MAPLAKKQKTPRGNDLIGFQTGHHCIVSGATGRGKTQYVVDVVLGEGVHQGRCCHWDAVVVMCDNISIKQPAFRRLAKGFTGAGGVKFVEGLPEGHEEESSFVESLEKNAKKKWRTLVIIDDLMTNTKSGAGEKFVNKLFTSARHLGTDIWEVTQTHTGSRTRRLNVGYLVCFATPADVSSLAHICRSIKPETKGHDILDAYRVATEGRDGHGCLVICLQQPNEFMFRNTSMDKCFDLGPAPLMRPNGSSACF